MSHDVPVSSDGAVVSLVQRDEVDAIHRLACAIWRRHYPGIITNAQIEYMLQQRYEPTLILAELTQPDLWWDKLSTPTAILGFASSFLTGERDEMKLDKLYVHTDFQRRGYGGRLIARASERARALGCARLVLAVNRNNVTAIAAYRKYGFTVCAEQVQHIGGGFVMDDHIMARELT
ncbi:MAG: GNAT family N-acetyltransferase [Betaproteobacteria bacterium]